MHPNKRLSGRKGPSAARRVGAILTFMLAGGLGSSAAPAQELTHRFINPSFGGNPFYSEHLLGIAGIHRPEEPKDPAAPAPTQEELLARQIRERLLGQLTNEIEDRIEDARPGDSGEFNLGNQRISFTRSQTETRVTFTNTTTGVTDVVVIPVPGANAALATATGRSAAAGSAERALGASGASFTPSNSLGLSLPPL